jgi:hypothetical protein
MVNTIGVVLGYSVVLTLSTTIEELGSRYPILELDGDRAVTVAVVVAIGIAIAFAQWFSLKEHLFQTKWWAVATAAGWLVGAVMATMATTFMSRTVGTGMLRNAIALGIVGLSLGVAQWLILREQVPRAWWWVVANAAGWIGSSLAMGEAIGSGAQMAAVGVIPSAITGLALIWLFRQPPAGMPGLGRIVS